MTRAYRRHRARRAKQPGIEKLRRKSSRRLFETLLEVAGIKEIKTWILGFGSLAKVLEPALLVKEVKEDLTKSLRFYGS